MNSKKGGPDTCRGAKNRPDECKPIASINYHGSTPFSYH
jgi:hypothetical protein